MSAEHERVLAMIEADMRLLRAENERLRAERQAVLDCVNLYGDDVLHKALDAIGWPTSTLEEPSKSAGLYAAIKAERLNLALVELWTYLRLEPGQNHTAFGAACGIDACILCLAEAKAKEALQLSGAFDENQPRHLCRCPCGHQWVETREDPWHAECPACTGDNFAISPVSREERP
jgi:hypothetical protein